LFAQVFVVAHPFPTTMPKRGVGFPVDELMVMLDCIEDILPIGMNEWEMVERRHNQVYQGWQVRNKESLKRKFRTLFIAKIPTGDPNCPPKIRRAKDLYEMIKTKSDLSEGDDDEDEEEDGDNDEEQDDSSSRAGGRVPFGGEEGKEQEMGVGGGAVGVKSSRAVSLIYHQWH
jgi:hypothetical protein